MFELTGKTAVVTGGSRGIGRAICLKLAGQGANIVLNYAGNAAAAEETRAACEALGVRALAVQGDVADPAACNAPHRYGHRGLWPGGYPGMQCRHHPGQPVDAHER